MMSRMATTTDAHSQRGRGRTLQMTYGDRIRRARLDAGLTQEQFAQEVGTTQRTIGHHELLDEPPTRGRRALVSMIQIRYGISADWLLEGHQVTGEFVAATQSDWALAA